MKQKGSAVHWHKSNIFSTGRYRRTNRTGVGSVFLTLLIILGGLYLNFQEVFQFFLGDHILLKFWLIWPILLFIFFIPLLLANSHRNVIAFLLLVVLFVVSFHMVVQGVRYGIIGVGMAAFSYALWVGLFIWVQYANLKTILWVSTSVFLGSALIQATAFLIDKYYFHGIFKVVTIDDVERFYGISTSIAIGCLQITVGMLIAISLYFIARSNLVKIVSLTIFGVLIVTLLLIMVRGPIIYGFASLSFLIFARCSQGVSFRALFTFTILAILGSGSIVAYDITNNIISWDFIQDAFTLTDRGNQGRIEQYLLASQYFVSKWWIPLFGHGSAELTQIPIAFGKPEFNAESSFIKSWLELGLVGLFPLLFLLIIIASGLIRKWNHPIIKRHLVFFAVLLLMLTHCLTHETFKTWIGSFYVMFSLAICVRLLVLAGYLPSFARLTLSPYVRKKLLVSAICK